MTHVFVYQEWDILKEQPKEQEHKVERITTNTSNRPSYGFLLQEARIKKRMTALDVANEIGVSAKLISLFENGSEIPNSDHANMLNELLKIN